MNVDRILDAMETLSLTDVRRIRTKADNLIERMQAWQQPELANTEKGISYRQEYTKCNKPSCKTCTAGQGHGPYWYATWRQGNKVKKQYIGKEYREIEPT